MAKTKFTDEHKAAAREQVEALRRGGFECTEKEVVAGMISNAIESIVTLASVGTDDQPGQPGLDTALARKLYDAKVDGDGIMAIRCILMARALLGARKPSASLEKAATELAQGLVTVFASIEMTVSGLDVPGLDVPGLAVPGGPS